MSRTPTRTRTRQPTSSRPATTKVGDVEYTRSYVFYGVAGTGKTTLAGDFPKPMLLLDFNDKGTDSISDIKGVEVSRIMDPETVDEWYYYLLEHPGEFKTIVFDTITGWQELYLRHLLTKKKKNADRAGEWGTMTKQEWGEVASYMKQNIIRFRDLDVEVVFLAQQRITRDEEEDDADGMILPEAGPALMPSVASFLNASVFVIGSTFIRAREVTKEVNGKKKTTEKKEYCLRIGPNPVYTTKIRKPKTIKLPDLIVDPSYDEIQDIIKGDY